MASGVVRETGGERSSRRSLICVRSLLDLRGPLPVLGSVQNVPEQRSGPSRSEQWGTVVT